ncbi:hypothetical protein SH668x_002081 [Planctomicrobium sp. SH668]|uniref:hypothetical protein n=1 Tax=Planctomicrobium sp. SH668 TaxID=3448126 RepID=UPI003F5B786D
MFSPFEELEDLANYLPEEGESVLLTREEGKLVCKPIRQENLRDGIENAEFYGLLVLSDERLRSVRNVPIQLTVAFLTLAAVLLYGVLGMTLKEWYLIVGLAPCAFLAMQTWICQRQRLLFDVEIAPSLIRELKLRGFRLNALMAGVSQHAELQLLFRKMVRWMPELGSAVRR